MAEDKDYNDVLDNILMHEENTHKNGYKEGFKTGSESGNPEAFHFGYHRGSQLGRELGFYLGTVVHHLNVNDRSENPIYSEKITNQLLKVKDLINTFPRTNSEEIDILRLAENIRANYKKACALLKISSNLPYSSGVTF